MSRARVMYEPNHPTPGHWEDYSDELYVARTKTLRKLLIEDKRIIGFAKDDGRVFIYTDSRFWVADDGNSGTFSAENEGAVARYFKATVQRPEGFPE